MIFTKKKGWVKLNSVLLVFALLFTTLGTAGWASPETDQSKAVPSPQRIEVQQYRDEFTKVYANPDGTLTAEVSLEPIHFKKDGKWVEIDNTLISSTETNYIENKNNKFKVKFPQNTKEENNSRIFKICH